MFISSCFKVSILSGVPWCCAVVKCATHDNGCCAAELIKTYTALTERNNTSTAPLFNLESYQDLQTGCKTLAG
jgi:hypothetical protein